MQWALAGILLLPNNFTPWTILWTALPGSILAEEGDARERLASCTPSDLRAQVRFEKVRALFIEG